MLRAFDTLPLSRINLNSSLCEINCCLLWKVSVWDFLTVNPFAPQIGLHDKLLASIQEDSILKLVSIGNRKLWRITVGHLISINLACFTDYDRRYIADYYWLVNSVRSSAELCQKEWSDEAYSLWVTTQSIPNIAISIGKRLNLIQCLVKTLE